MLQGFFKARYPSYNTYMYIHLYKKLKSKVKVTTASQRQLKPNTEISWYVMKDYHDTLHHRKHSTATQSHHCKNSINRSDLGRKF